VPSSMFEFGPLLAGRDRTGYQTGCYPEHTAKFRITNNGLFKARADFWLKSEGPGADPAHTAGAASESKKKPGGSQALSCHQQAALSCTVKWMEDACREAQHCQ
jgi:hypothetical protein